MIGFYDPLFSTTWVLLSTTQPDTKKVAGNSSSSSNSRILGMPTLVPGALRERARTIDIGRVAPEPQGFCIQSESEIDGNFGGVRPRGVWQVLSPDAGF